MKTKSKAVVKETSKEVKYPLPGEDVQLKTAEQRARECESAVEAVLKMFDCHLLIAQRTLDGQVHPLTGVQLVVLFIPNS